MNSRVRSMTLIFLEVAPCSRSLDTTFSFQHPECPIFASSSLTMRTFQAIVSSLLVLVQPVFFKSSALYICLNGTAELSRTLPGLLVFFILFDALDLHCGLLVMCLSSNSATSTMFLAAQNGAQRLHQGKAVLKSISDPL